MPRKKKPALQYTLSDLKAVVSKWLLLDHYILIDVICAVYLANMFRADPLWMLLIAPPSSAKTETLRAFDGHDDAYLISNLTPATLVSGIIAKRGRPEPSLLPQLTDKLVILKDFTTVLSMRSEAQAEILAQLREIYDGSYTKIFGNGKEIVWNGRLGILGACTPAYDKHYAVIGAMGERFLLFRTENKDPLLVGLRAQKFAGREDEMRSEIKSALHRFINQFEGLIAIKPEPNEIINHQIVALACFCAYGRCPVERDYKNQTILYEPQPEGPARLSKQLSLIGLALALVNGKRGIDEDTYSIVKKIGRDLLPGQRRHIFSYLWENKKWEDFSSWATTTDVSEATGMPATTTRLILEDLMTVGAINRQKGEPEGVSGRPPWQWQLSAEAVKFIGLSEVFDS